MFCGFNEYLEITNKSRDCKPMKSAELVNVGYVSTPNMSRVANPHLLDSSFSGVEVL